MVGITHTAKGRIDFPDFHRALARELAQKHFQIIHWLANDEQHNHIRNEESAATIFVCSEWKPPNVAQTDRCLDAWHQKFRFIRPCWALFKLNFVCVTAGIEMYRTCIIFHCLKWIQTMNIYFGTTEKWVTNCRDE